MKFQVKMKTSLLHNNNDYCFIIIAIILVLFVNLKCYMCTLFSLVSNSKTYDNLISTADIFYMNPNPLDKQISIRINELSRVQNKNDIKLIIHGYLADKDHVAVSPLRYAYLAKGTNTLYMADWNQTSNLLYPTTRYLIYKVAVRLSKLLQAFLNRHQINPRNVHIIGHSLGAHIAGIMGKHFKGRIGRITGLDPALPLFNSESTDALKPTDAIFVDVIHTDGYIFGDLTPRGHIDFYPNYGVYLQPGCIYLDVLTLTACSHYRAPILYAETIQLPYRFPSVKCNLLNIRSRNITNCWNSPEVVLMGEYISKKARGTYFLETNNVSPYGRGAYSRRNLIT